MNYIDMPIDQLRDYKPEQTKEADFDSFWSATKQESKNQPLNGEAVKADFALKNIKVYDVYYDGYKNSRIHGRLIMPQNASKQNKVPALVMYHGYNYNNAVISHALPYVLAGYAVFEAEARGQNPLSADHNNYGCGCAQGWMTLGINDYTNYYYRYVYMDCVRAVDYMCSREDIDESRVAVTGGSQGGGLSLAVGALAPQVKVVMADVPFLCHFRRGVLTALCDPYLEIAHYFRIFDSQHRQEAQIYRTLSYFDNLNLCTDINADVLMGIGLEDQICPPSTTFAVFNTIKSNKDLKVYPEYAHGGFSLHEDEKLEFLIRHIQ